MAEFIDWAPASTTNPYVEDVKALADLNDEGKGMVLIVPKKDALKTRNFVAKAANDIGKTARVRVNAETVIDNGKDTGNVRFVFTLSPRHKPRKGSEYVASAEDTTEDATTEDTTEDATTEDAPVEPPKPSTARRK